MVEQPKNAPNHGVWTLGHVIFSCQGIAAELGAGQWIPDDWEARSGYRSTPSSDPSRYPARSEMLSPTLRAVCVRRSLLPTLGHLLIQVVVGHTVYHAGQLSGAGRLAKRRLEFSSRRPEKPPLLTQRWGPTKHRRRGEGDCLALGVPEVPEGVVSKLVDREFLRCAAS